MKSFLLSLICIFIDHIPLDNHITKSVLREQQCQRCFKWRLECTDADGYLFWGEWK